MVNLWERLGYIFGHKFSSTYGESAVTNTGALTAAATTWQHGLHGVDKESLIRGLRACADGLIEWPTLPDFRKVCLGSGVNEFGLDYIPQVYRQELTDAKRLEYKSVTKEEGISKFAELKKLARGSINTESK